MGSPQQTPGTIQDLVVFVMLYQFQHVTHPHRARRCLRLRAGIDRLGRQRHGSLHVDARPHRLLHGARHLSGLRHHHRHLVQRGGSFALKDCRERNEAAEPTLGLDSETKRGDQDKAPWGYLRLKRRLVNLIVINLLASR